MEKCKLFKGINDIEEFLETIEYRYINFNRGETILNLDDKVSEIFIVIKGKILLYKIDQDGNKGIMNVLKEDDFFGTALAIQGVNSLSAIEAVTKGKILAIKYDSIFKSTHFTNQFHQNILLTLAAKNIELNKKIYLLNIKKLRTRILSYLSDYDNGNYFEIPLNINQLSDFLSVDRSTLSRELSKLKKEEKLDYYSNTFKILKK